MLSIFAMTLILGFVGAFSATVQVHAESLAGSRPNIILVMTDDQGLGDLSCMVIGCFGRPT